MWFQRDIDQITHSIAFRKLQYKSQLLPEEDPICRSRLIHTIEASRIATEISDRLGLNKDLTEAIMMGHDIASPPYGAIGNKFLKEKVLTFDHELAGAIMLQTLSREKLPVDNNKRAEILDYITTKSGTGPFYSAEIPGEVLKSAYPLQASTKKIKNNENDVYIYLISPQVIDGVLCHGKSHGNPSTLEGQVVQFADNIAYITQDIDDLHRAGLMDKDDLGKHGNKIIDWPKTDEGYPDDQKLKQTFDGTRGKRIAAFIERYVEQNKKMLNKNEKNPVLECDPCLQRVIDGFWEFIEGYYEKLSIKTSSAIQEAKLEQLWEILNGEEQIGPYKDFIDDCKRDTRFSYYQTVDGWLCAYFISHLSSHDVDLIIDSYHRRDYSFDLDIDWSSTE